MQGDIIVQYGHPLDKPLLATPKQYDEFVKSAVWLDFMNFFEDRRKLVSMELIHSEDIDNIRKLQSEAKTIDTVLGLPEQLREWSAMQLEEDSKARKEDRNG